jgi:hypothetical protein
MQFSNFVGLKDCDSSFPDPDDVSAAPLWHEINPQLRPALSKAAIRTGISAHSSSALVTSNIAPRLQSHWRIDEAQHLSEYDYKRVMLRYSQAQMSPRLAGHP